MSGGGTRNSRALRFQAVDHSSPRGRSIVSLGPGVAGRLLRYFLPEVAVFSSRLLTGNSAVEATCYSLMSPSPSLAVT